MRYVVMVVSRKWVNIVGDFELGLVRYEWITTGGNCELV